MGKTIWSEQTKHKNITNRQKIAQEIIGQLLQFKQVLDPDKINNLTYQEVQNCVFYVIIIIYVAGLLVQRPKLQMPHQNKISFSDTRI